MTLPSHANATGPHDHGAPPPPLTPATARAWLTTLPGEEPHTRAWALLSIRQHLKNIRPALDSHLPEHIRRDAAHVKQNVTALWEDTLNELPEPARRDFRSMDNLNFTIYGAEFGTPGLMILALTLGVSLLLELPGAGNGIQSAVLVTGFLAAFITGKLTVKAAVQAGQRQGGTFIPSRLAWSPASAQSLTRTAASH